MVQRKEGHKKIRKRVSMKEKLAEKKNEISGQPADGRQNEKEKRRGL